MPTWLGGLVSSIPSALHSPPQVVWSGWPATSRNTLGCPVHPAWLVCQCSVVLIWPSWLRLQLAQWRDHTACVSWCRPASLAETHGPSPPPVSCFNYRVRPPHYNLPPVAPGAGLLTGPPASRQPISHHRAGCISGSGSCLGAGSCARSTSAPPTVRSTLLRSNPWGICRICRHLQRS